MKKTFLRLSILCMAVSVLASCGISRSIIPQAVNTVNLASFRDLNLTENSYTIFNTISAEATVTLETRNKSRKIMEENGEFKLYYTYDKKTGKWYFDAYQGMLMLGYFGPDYDGGSDNLLQAEVIVRRLAIYRAINLAKEYGADALVAPTISTNVAEIGGKIYFKSTVTAKLVRLTSN